MPTKLPSATPTAVPSTKRPSAAPTTRRPSPLPLSLAETEDLWTAELQATLADDAAGAAGDDAGEVRSYFELDVSYAQTTNTLFGGAAEWATYLSSLQVDALAGLVPTNLSAAVVDADAASRRSLLSSAPLRSWACGDAAAAARVFDALMSAQLGLSQPGQVSKTLCGESWYSVGNCAAAASSAHAAVCIDCTDPCSAAAHCAGHGSFAMSPGVASACASGEVSQIRVLSFSMQSTRTAPAMLQLAVNASGEKRRRKTTVMTVTTTTTTSL
jgi:hypothetical protein